MNRMLCALTGVTAVILAMTATAAETDWSKVDQAMGRKGSAQSDAVHKFSLPRSDLKVTVDGVAIKPALALGGWVAFESSSSGSGSMCMGDLVLTDTEINPVMKHLIDNGMQITAVHNHLLRPSVPIYYMHISGDGDAVKLAQTLKAALASSHTPLAEPPASAPPPIDLDTAALEKTLGYKGKANGGVYQFNIPRAEAVTEKGMAIPPAMGTATSINFQATGSGRAATSGDFVLTGSEVNPVLRALRGHGIEVTALHSHMIDESPRLFFMHFWANDDVQKLAQGLRAALAQANVKRGA